MAKLLIALACLFTVCIAQQASYPYNAYLDADGYFLIRWDVRTAQRDFEMQFVVNATGWISLLIASEDGSYADLIWGGYDDAKGTGYLADMHFNLTSGPSHDLPAEDASADLVLQSASFENGITTLTIKRSIVTGDMDDVGLRSGPMLLGWSFCDKDDATVPHTNAGFATLALIP